MLKPKPPEDACNWKALNIYLFDNGQSYSPPRKYHLAADQLEWWLVTRKYLANSQYGLIDQPIDLYTINGQKINSPLELENETAYVAVKPPDLFIEADYEKYIIRASKSWEKRQSLRGQYHRTANAQNPNTLTTLTDSANITKETSDVKVIQSNSISTPENSVLIPTALNNMPAQKPKSTDNTDRRTNQNNTSTLPDVNYNGDKKSTTQQISGSNNINSLSQLMPVRKPLFKKRESLKLGNSKILPPPDINIKNTTSVRYPGSKNESSKQANSTNKSMNNKYLSNRRNLTQPVLPKVKEVLNELNKYSEKEPKSKNVIKVNENEIITTNYKNAEPNAEPKFSAIHIDVNTLEQFKKNLDSEKSHETFKTNKDSPVAIFENEIVNESKQNIIKAKGEQNHSYIIADMSVCHITNIVENGSQKYNTQVKQIKTQNSEMATDDKSVIINASKEADVIVENDLHVNVQGNLKPNCGLVTDQFTEISPKVLSSVVYANMQDDLSKINSKINISKPIDMELTSKIETQDTESKPVNGSIEAHKTYTTLVNDQILSIENNPEKFASHITVHRAEIEVIPSKNKGNDANLIARASAVALTGQNNIAEIEAVSSKTKGNDANLVARASTVTLAGDSKYIFATTDAVTTVSANGKNDDFRNESPKSVKENSERLKKSVSISVEREDVVNLKLDIDVLNHNISINPKPTMASTSINKSPYILNQNESQEIFLAKSTVIHKPSNTWKATNDDKLKDDQYTVVVKYVSRKLKEGSPKSSGNNRDFTIIVPTIQLDYTKTCCSHCQKELKHDEVNSQNPPQRISSMRIPVKKVTSCLSLLNAMARTRCNSPANANAPVNQFTEPCAINKNANLSCIMNPSKTTSCITKDLLLSEDICCKTRDKISENREGKRKSVAIHEILNSKDASCCASNTSEIIIENKRSDFFITNTDKATQTEICNLVMEARLQEDGNYALFLPSIEMLKKYKLSC